MSFGKHFNTHLMKRQLFTIFITLFVVTASGYAAEFTNETKTKLAKTAADVWDDAVKIGLGAIVGGIFSYLGMRATQKYDERKEYTRRKRDALEKIADEIGRIQAMFTEASYKGIKLAKTSTATVPEDQQQKARDAFFKLYDECTQEMVRFQALRSRLMVLGMTETAQELLKCVMLLQKIHSCISKLKPDVAAITKINEEVRPLLVEADGKFETIFKSISAEHRIKE